MNRRAPRILLAVLTVLATLPIGPTVAADHVEDLDREAPFACGGRECIPAIDEPRFDDGAWLAEDDAVIGVAAGGVARAYAIRILDWHEIVNDEIDGRAIAVTYCPLCATGIVFDRNVDGQLLSFGVSGRLYRNDLVMQDRGTDTLWSQILGEAIWGQLHGSVLDIVPATTTTWGKWKAAHPSTQALARPDTFPESRYEVYPYGDYATSEHTLQKRDHTSGELHPKERVVGAWNGSDAVAIPFDLLAREGVAMLKLGAREVVAVMAAGGPHVYDADGRAWRLVHEALVDGNGTRHDPATGRALDGGNASLARVDSMVAFWFAWYDFHPGTRLVSFMTPDPDAPESGTEPVNGVGLTGPPGSSADASPVLLPFGLLAAVAVVIVIAWRRSIAQ